MKRQIAVLVSALLMGGGTYAQNVSGAKTESLHGV